MGGAVVLYELPISFLEEVDYTIREKKFKFFTIWSSCSVVEQGTCIWGTILHDGTIFSQIFHMDWRYSLGVASPPSNSGKWRFIGIPYETCQIPGGLWNLGTGSDPSPQGFGI